MNRRGFFGRLPFVAVAAAITTTTESRPALPPIYKWGERLVTRVNDPWNDSHVYGEARNISVKDWNNLVDHVRALEEK